MSLVLLRADLTKGSSPESQKESKHKLDNSSPKLSEDKKAKSSKGDKHKTGKSKKDKEKDKQDKHKKSSSRNPNLLGLTEEGKKMDSASSADSNSESRSEHKKSSKHKKSKKDKSSGDKEKKIKITTNSTSNLDEGTTDKSEGDKQPEESLRPPEIVKSCDNSREDESASDDGEDDTKRNRPKR